MRELLRRMFGRPADAAGWGEDDTKEDPYEDDNPYEGMGT